MGAAAPGRLERHADAARARSARAARPVPVAPGARPAPDRHPSRLPALHLHRPGERDPGRAGPARARDRRASSSTPGGSATRRRGRSRWACVARLAWAKERRVCQTARLALPDGGTLVVGNLHTTSFAADPRLAEAESLRAAVFLDGVASPDEPCVLAGDFNARPSARVFAEVAGWGFVRGGHLIDHVLVRGIETGPVHGVAEGAEAPRRAPALRPRADRGRDRMTFEEVRARFPVLAERAYLNAGTFGPLSRGDERGDRRRGRARDRARPQRRRGLRPPAGSGASGCASSWRRRSARPPTPSR